MAQKLSFNVVMKQLIPHMVETSLLRDVSAQYGYWCHQKGEQITTAADLHIVMIIRAGKPYRYAVMANNPSLCSISGNEAQELVGCELVWFITCSP